MGYCGCILLFRIGDWGHLVENSKHFMHNKLHLSCEWEAFKLEVKVFHRYSS